MIKRSQYALWWVLISFFLICIPTIFLIKILMEDTQSISGNQIVFLFSAVIIVAITMIFCSFYSWGFHIFLIALAVIFTVFILAPDNNPNYLVSIEDWFIWSGIALGTLIIYGVYYGVFIAIKLIQRYRESQEYAASQLNKSKDEDDRLT